MKPETIVTRFAGYLDKLDAVSVQTKGIVLGVAKQKAQDRELTGADTDAFAQELHFQVIRAEIVKEHWDEIPEEDRLLLCFPAAGKVGDSFDLPKRGRGTLLRRRLRDPYAVGGVGGWVPWHLPIPDCARRND